MNILNVFSIDFWISLLYCLPGILIGLSFHEFAHAYAAHKMGDDTALSLGRMTVNPLAHVDPIGMACMVLLGFGWAKPVPVNPNNFVGNRKKADIIVSLAGITMNFAIALITLFLVYFLVYIFKVTNDVVINILQCIISVNVCLMIFNLIPVPPLDGSHVLEDLLIPKVGIEPFLFIRKNSLIILIIVLMILNSTGLLDAAIFGVTNLLYKLFDLIFSAYIVI